MLHYSSIDRNTFHIMGRLRAFQNDASTSTVMLTRNRISLRMPSNWTSRPLTSDVWPHINMSTLYLRLMSVESEWHHHPSIRLSTFEVQRLRRLWRHRFRSENWFCLFFFFCDLFHSDAELAESRPMTSDLSGRYAGCDSGNRMAAAPYDRRLRQRRRLLIQLTYLSDGLPYRRSLFLVGSGLFTGSLWPDRSHRSR